MGFAAPGDVRASCSARPARSFRLGVGVVTHGHLGGTPPPVDLAAEQALGDADGRRVRPAPQRAHDLSDGGLAQALVESACAGASAPASAVAGDPFVQLFSESTARALVAVAPADVDRLAAVAAEHGVPLTRLGEVTADPALAVEDVLAVPLAELRAAHEATLPRLFD